MSNSKTLDITEHHSDSYTERLEKLYPAFKEYFSWANVAGVQNWLKTHVPHNVECQKSFLRILNLNHLDFHADNVEEEQKKAVRLAITQHLDGIEQVRFINFLFSIEGIIDLDYFRIIEQQNQKLSEVLKDGFWKVLTTSLFHQEKFSTLEQIQRLFNHDFLTEQHDSFYLIFNNNQSFIDEKTRESLIAFKSWNLRVDNAVFFPYYDIMFDYSEEKENYLQYKNITLPSYDDCLRTQDVYKTRLGVNADNDKLAQHVLNVLEHYRVRAYYHKLDEQMPDNDNENNHHDTLVAKIKI